MSRVSFASAIVLTVLVAAGPLAAQSKDDIRCKSGNIVVRRSVEHLDGEDGPVKLTDHMILRDQINFGRGFEDANIAECRSLITIRKARSVWRCRGSTGFPAP